MERIKESEYRELFEEPKQPDIIDKTNRLKQLELKKKHSKQESMELKELRDELNDGKRLTPYTGSPGTPGPDNSDIKVDHTNWGKSISQAISEDIINKPDHYHKGGIDAIEILESKFGLDMSKGFFLGNVIKYVLRYQSKGGIEDLEKAGFYLDALIQNERGQAYERKK